MKNNYVSHFWNISTLHFYNQSDGHLCNTTNHFILRNKICAFICIQLLTIHWITHPLPEHSQKKICLNTNTFLSPNNSQNAIHHYESHFKAYCTHTLTRIGETSSLPIEFNNFCRSGDGHQFPSPLFPSMAT